jgi:hypothetical protein
VGRIRSIKPELPQSATLGRVSRDCRLCFVLLFTLADDEGRMRGDANMLASLLFPYDSDAREQMPAWLRSLEAVGAVRWYEAAGQAYVQIVKWTDHQRVEKPKTSRFPAPPDASPTVPGNVADESPTSRGSVADASPTVPGRVAVGREGRGREGRGAGTWPAPLVSSPLEYQRKHGQHVSGFCDWVCLPRDWFDERVNRLIAAGRSPELAATEAEAFAVLVREEWTKAGRVPAERGYDFWNARWQEAYGAKVTPKDKERQDAEARHAFLMKQTEDRLRAVGD